MVAGRYRRTLVPLRTLSDKFLVARRYSRYPGAPGKNASILAVRPSGQVSLVGSSPREAGVTGRDRRNTATPVSCQELLVSIQELHKHCTI